MEKCTYEVTWELVFWRGTLSTVENVLLDDIQIIFSLYLCTYSGTNEGCHSPSKRPAASRRILRGFRDRSQRPCVQRFDQCYRKTTCAVGLYSPPREARNRHSHVMWNDLAPKGPRRVSPTAAAASWCRERANLQGASSTWHPRTKTLLCQKQLRFLRNGNAKIETEHGYKCHLFTFCLLSNFEDWHYHLCCSKTSVRYRILR